MPRAACISPFLQKWWCFHLVAPQKAVLAVAAAHAAGLPYANTLMWHHHAVVVTGGSWAASLGFAAGQRGEPGHTLLSYMLF